MACRRLGVSSIEAAWALGAQSTVRKSVLGLNRFWLVPFGLCLAGNAIPLSPIMASQDISLRETKNLKLAIYPKGATDQAATISVYRIYKERRTAGFFKVRLLPLVVVQGVRLDIPNSDARTNWSSAFLTRLVPLKNPGNAIEWRGLSVYLQSESTPRLQAQRLFFPDGLQSRICDMKDVTLQTDEGPKKLREAQLQLQEHAGRISWGTSDSPMEWDLFTLKQTETQPNPPTQKGTQ